MKTNAPPGADQTARDEELRATRTTSNSATACTSPIASDLRPAQEQKQLTDVAHVGAVWKSPRDKRQCIQAGFKSFNGSPPYLDLRVFELDAQGRMRATTRGITISPPRLNQLAKLIGDAARKAQKLGLTAGSS